MNDLCVQADLVGNRAIKPDAWSVISALEAAFPLLLGPTVDTARRSSDINNKELLARAFIQQVSCTASQHPPDPKLHSINSKWRVSLIACINLVQRWLLFNSKEIVYTQIYPFTPLTENNLSTLSIKMNRCKADKYVGYKRWGSQ